jgi:hypothetical protein
LDLPEDSAASKRLAQPPTSDISQQRRLNSKGLGGPAKGSVLVGPELAVCWLVLSARI